MIILHYSENDVPDPPHTKPVYTIHNGDGSLIGEKPTDKSYVFVGFVDPEEWKEKIC